MLSSYTLTLLELNWLFLSFMEIFKGPVFDSFESKESLFASVLSSCCVGLCSKLPYSRPEGLPLSWTTTIPPGTMQCSCFLCIERVSGPHKSLSVTPCLGRTLVNTPTAQECFSSPRLFWGSGLEEEYEIPQKCSIFQQLQDRDTQCQRNSVLIVSGGWLEKVPGRAAQASSRMM